MPSYLSLTLLGAPVNIVTPSRRERERALLGNNVLGTLYNIHVGTIKTKQHTRPDANDQEGGGERWCPLGEGYFLTQRIASKANVEEEGAGEEGGEEKRKFAGVTKLVGNEQIVGENCVYREPAAPAALPAAGEEEEEEEEARFKDGDLPLSFRRLAAGDACMTICPVYICYACLYAVVSGTDR